MPAFFCSFRAGRRFRLLALCIPLLFCAGLVSQHAFATTYIINDGPRVFHYTGFSADPETVLDQAGLTLEAEDSFTTQAETITICRAPVITVVYHGKAFSVSTSGETVGQLLNRLKLEIGPEDVVSASMQAPVSNGMVLRVDQILCRRESYTTVLPCGSVTRNAPGLPEGVREVLVPGRDGTLLRTADITYVNGEETQREILSEIQTEAPVTEIVALGTGAPLSGPDPTALPVIGENTITLPTGEVLTYTKVDYVRATAYTHTDAGCDTTTATGSTVRVGTVAVDPRYIPYGTRMFIMASDGSYVYGVAQAEDCGGDIKGDRMDLYMPTFADCMRFGRRRCTVYFLG